MCGIVGYIGKNPEKILIENLKKLEYRGYDSAGIAVRRDNKFDVYKAKGEIKNLEQIVISNKNDGVGIGHTRWATHGKPNELNAHPHVSSDNEWAVVHNGIIENFNEIKQKLTSHGYSFYSETDTEVIAKLLEYYDGTDIEKLKLTTLALKGSYALCVVNAKKDTLYFAKNKSPLFISIKDNLIMLSSDVINFCGFSNEYYSLPDGVFGCVKKDELKFYDALGEVNISPVKLDVSFEETLNNYKHYMIKEIYETKPALKNAIDYYAYKENREFFNNVDLQNIKKIYFVGCGTAFHACLVGQGLVEKELDVECEVCVASEFRYSNKKIDDKVIVVLVSQSGETADTLAAFELAKKKGAYTVGVVNVEYSTLAKGVDAVVPIKAGVEIAVASTKAYSLQLACLWVFVKTYKEKLFNTPIDLSEIKKLYNSLDFNSNTELKLIADVLRYNEQLFMIGRGMDYYTALEAGLKIKETSYINSDTYFAGELKHGFLALITENTYVVVFATNKSLLDKTLNNAYEVIARGAKVILFTCFDIDNNVKSDFYHVINIPNIDNSLQPIINIIPWQLIAYYTSIAKGLNPDKPRNLAKSVTVE